MALVESDSGFPFPFQVYGKDFGDDSELIRRADTGRIIRYALADPYTIFTDPESDHRITNLYLVPNPCMDETGSNKMSCQEMCTEPSELFDGWRGLWTCLMLASLSLGMQQSDLDDKFSSIIKDTLFEVAPGFNLSHINGTAILETTYQCALASCQAKPVGSCLTEESIRDDAMAFFDGRSDDWDFLGGNDGGMPQYCVGVEETTNVDIGGPGVSWTKNIFREKNKKDNHL